MSTQAEFNAGFAAIFGEAGGVLSLHVVRIEAGIDLLLGATQGDLEARMLLSCVEQALGKPRVPCLLCEEMTPDLPKVLLVITADREDPSRAFAMTLCDNHARLTDMQLAERANERIFRTGETRVVDRRAFHPAPRRQ